MKSCKNCLRTLPLECFYLHATSKGGVRARCKECILSADRGRQRDQLNRPRRAGRVYDKARMKVLQSNGREEAKDWYVRSRMVASGFPKESITPVLMDTYRIILKIKREVWSSNEQHQ